MTMHHCAEEEVSLGIKRLAQSSPGSALTLRGLLSTAIGPVRQTPRPQAKALIALGLAVSTNCQGCAARHAAAAAQSGSLREEALGAIQRGLLMGCGASLETAARALEAFDEETARRNNAAGRA